MSIGQIHNNYPIDGRVVVTTDATSTPLMSHDFTADSACHVNIRVICRDPATGDAKCWHREAVAKRVGSGVPTAIGAILNTLSQGDVSLALATISIVIAGGNVSINVVGLAGVTLEWFGEFSALCIEQP